MITEFLLFALIAEKEAAMATGRKTTIPNARWKPPEKEGEKGKLEIDPPRKKLPPHVQYAKKNKRRYRKVK